MKQLIFVRHGESWFNHENRFTGWTDVELTEKGRKEAREAGRILKENGYSFDIAFTSVLGRTIKSLWLIQDEMDLMWVPVVSSWRLNERHYGILQELQKGEAIKQFGDEQVQLWRRGFNSPPPKLAVSDPRFHGNDPRYKHLTPEEIPLAESLKDARVRVLSYWQEEIAPLIQKGKKVLLVGHGNSLRVLRKYLDDIPDRDMAGLRIPTGKPMVYELNENLKGIRHYYLDKNINNSGEIL